MPTPFSSNESVKNNLVVSQEGIVDSFLETDVYRTLSEEEQANYATFKPEWKRNYEFMNTRAYNECVTVEEKIEYRELIRKVPSLFKVKKFDVKNYKKTEENKDRKEFVLNQIRIEEIKMNAENKLAVKIKDEKNKLAVKIKYEKARLRIKEVLGTIIKGAPAGEVINTVETGNMGLYHESGPTLGDAHKPQSLREEIAENDFANTQVFEQHLKKIRPMKFTLYPDGDEGALAIQSIQSRNREVQQPIAFKTEKTSSDEPTSKHPKARALGVFDQEDFSSR